MGSQHQQHKTYRGLRQVMMKLQSNSPDPELNRPGTDLPYLMPEAPQTNLSSSNPPQHNSSSADLYKSNSGGGRVMILSPLNVRIVIVTAALLVVLLAVLALNCAIRCCVRRLFATRFFPSSAPHHNNHQTVLRKHQLASLPIIFFRISNNNMHCTNNNCNNVNIHPPHLQQNPKETCSSHGIQFNDDPNTRSAYDDNIQQQQSSDDEGVHHHRGPSLCDLDNTQTINQPSTEDLDMDSCCSICLGEFRAGEALRQLPACNHLFHVVCIDPWLSRHSASCPICRALATPVPPPPSPLQPHYSLPLHAVASPVSPLQPHHSLPLPSAACPVVPPSQHSLELHAAVSPVPSSHHSLPLHSAASPVSSLQPLHSLPLPAAAACPVPPSHHSLPLHATSNSRLPPPHTLPLHAGSDSLVPPAESTIQPPNSPHPHNAANQLLLALQLHIFMLCNPMPR